MIFQKVAKLIMGNQLLKGYTLQGEPITAIGCEKMWRIYHGHKQNTNTQATIFAIEKKNLNKNEREELIAFAKKQAMGLARIRHPGVLAISETLIEDEMILAFSTEQVLGNLSTLAREGKLKQIVSNEIQLRLNLFPILDTVQFLHDNVKTVHMGLNFDNIYITKEGKWKISGFSNSQIYSGEGLEDLRNFRCSNYYFVGPEVAVQKKFEKKSDVYALGVLILDLLLVLNNKYQQKTYKNEAEYQQNFEKDLIKKINNQALQKLQNYKQLKLLLKNIFARDTDKRASLSQLSSSKWLNDKLVLTVRYLENITNYDNKQQIQFLKGLMGILNHFQPRILLRKIIPLLLDLVKFKHLIPSVIFICLQMMKNGKIISEADFRQKIWPQLRKVVQGKQMTAHSLFLFVDNMEKIEKVVGLQELNTCIVPLYVKCFDCPPKLKQLALHKTDYILTKMDYQFVKTKMIPKVMNCMKQSNTDIHKKSLIALKKTIKILDTQTITSIVLPGLQNSKKVGGDPFINAITVAIYTSLGRILPSQLLSSKLIPTILPYLSDPNVSAQDFYQYKNALTTMIEKIEGERKKFWDENSHAQGPVYSQKDFEFGEDAGKEMGQVDSGIGKGDYNFLSNYNSGSERKQGENEQAGQGQQMKRQQSDDFNFASPFDEAKINAAYGQQQQPPSYNQQQQHQQQQYQQVSYSQQPQPQPIKIQNNLQFQPLSSVAPNYRPSPPAFSQVDTQFTPISWQQPRSNPSNQPFSPETRHNKLKGPSQVQPAKMRKPQPQPVLDDPWASIMQVPTGGAAKGGELGSFAGMGGVSMSTTGINSNSGGNSNGQFGYMNNPNNKPVYNDDPFAELQQKHSQINSTGVSMSWQNAPASTGGSGFGLGGDPLGFTFSNVGGFGGSTNLQQQQQQQGVYGVVGGYQQSGTNNPGAKTQTKQQFDFDLI